MPNLLIAPAAVALLLSLPTAFAQTRSPGAGPIVVLETAKGTIEFETYPEEAPKTVARILELAKKGFYNGQRFHRDEPLLVQVGDPTSRDVSREAWWGRAGSGKPIGAAEITKKRRHVRGAVGMAYSGSNAASAESQFYILRRASPPLDGKYAVFGRVLTGMDVVEKIKRGDVLKKVSVKE